MHLSHFWAICTSIWTKTQNRRSNKPLSLNYRHFGYVSIVCGLKNYLDTFYSIQLYSSSFATHFQHQFNTQRFLASVSNTTKWLFPNGTKQSKSGIKGFQSLNLNQITLQSTFLDVSTHYGPTHIVKNCLRQPRGRAYTVGKIDQILMVQWYGCHPWLWPRPSW
jgi:hypothetical protein